MKLLVLTAFYPQPGVTRERMFVHVRDLYYQEHGAEVTVLDFAAKEDYGIDGIQVITEASFRREPGLYAGRLCICHSANLRNHYRFLKRYQALFPHLVFFFHGHEVLHLTVDYPLPYPYLRQARPSRRLFQKLYDTAKLALWGRYYRALSGKADFVFVSRWLFDRCRRYMKGRPPFVPGDPRVHIIPNSAGRPFEEGAYSPAGEKPYDFVTVRGDLDGSKYCADLVAAYARACPDKRFLIIGAGRYFDHDPLPENAVLINRSLSHPELLSYLDQARCGLMPTREDTQGVMTCEMITYGLPVITSDIDVCHEFFGGLPNVRLIPNDRPADIAALSAELAASVPCPKCRRWSAENTIARELTLFAGLCAGADAAADGKGNR